MGKDAGFKTKRYGDLVVLVSFHSFQAILAKSGGLYCTRNLTAYPGPPGFSEILRNTTCFRFVQRIKKLTYKRGKIMRYSLVLNQKMSKTTYSSYFA
jgi:hypothetical protein